MENSFGEYLRQQRENRELSLEDISKKTRIQKKFLMALEKDQYEQLPGPVFVRGFIRAYAEEVGLNPEQTIMMFEEYLKDTKPVLSGPKSGPIPAKPRVMVYLVLGISGLILIGLVASIFFSLRQDAGAKKADSAIIEASGVKEKPVIEKPDSEISAVKISAPYKVNIKAIELCWLLATIDGKTTREIMLYSGDSINIDAEERLSLLIGNAGGVEVMVNSVKLKQLGGHWKPVRFLIPEDIPRYLPQTLQPEGHSGTEDKKPQ